MTHDVFTLPEKPPGIPFLRFKNPDVIERLFPVHIEHVRKYEDAQIGLFMAFMRAHDDPARQRMIELQIAACCWFNCGGFAYHWRGQTRAFLTPAIEELYSLPPAGTVGKPGLIELEMELVA